MAVFRVVFVCVAILASFLVNSEETHSVDTQEVDWKFDILLREAPIIANHVRKLKVDTPTAKLQLSNIITSFLLDLTYGLYSLNVVVPNLVNTDRYQVIVNATETLNAYIYNLQHYVNKDDAKQGLIGSLTDVVTVIPPIKAHLKVPNKFASIQYNYALSIFIYGLYKVKAEVLYFDYSNKQINEKISECIQDLGNTFTGFASTSNKALDEFHRLSLLLSTITERVVNRCENWVDLNPNNHKGIEIAKAVVKNMRENFGREINAVNDLKTVAEIKTELASIYKSGATEIQSLADVDYAENLGGIEFIRSTMLDAIAVGVAFRDNVNSMPF